MPSTVLTSDKITALEIRLFERGAVSFWGRTLTLALWGKIIFRLTSSSQKDLCFVWLNHEHLNLTRTRPQLYNSWTCFWVHQAPWVLHLYSQVIQLKHMKCWAQEKIESKFFEQEYQEYWVNAMSPRWERRCLGVTVSVEYLQQNECWCQNVARLHLRWTASPLFCPSDLKIFHSNFAFLRLAAKNDSAKTSPSKHHISANFWTRKKFAFCDHVKGEF